MSKAAFLLLGIFTMFSIGTSATSEPIEIRVVTHPTADYIRILPETYPIPGTTSGPITVIASPGEFEPASFVIHAFSSVDNLKIKSSPIKGKTGTIKASNVDIRIVKCWYQDKGCELPSNGQRYSGIRILVPELLLKNDSLVKVNEKEMDNYLVLKYPNGIKEICISKDDAIQGVRCSSPTGDEFPVKDEQELMPVDIQPKTNKQIWLTFKIPDDAVPGIYMGEIQISQSNKLLKTVPIRLRVLPIKLLAPYYDSSIYYMGIFCPDFEDKYVSAQLKDREQFKRDMKNLIDHGVSNPRITNDLNFSTYLGIGNSRLGEQIRYTYSNNKFYFKGTIDNVRIYKRALDDKEISEHCKAPEKYDSSDTDLAGAWNLDGTDSTTAADSSNFHNNGKICGALPVVAEPNSGFIFDGEDDYIDCGFPENLRIGKESATLEAWIKTTDTRQMLIISTRNGSEQDNYWYEVGLMPTGQLYLDLAAPDILYRTLLVGKKSLNDGHLHHLVAVRNAEQQNVKLYVDGQLESEGKDTTAGHCLYYDENKRNDRFLEILKIRKETGMNNKTLFLNMRYGNPQNPIAIEKIAKEVADTISFLRPHGVKEVYFYALDEAQGSELTSQQPVCDVIHKAGGKTFVAGSRPGFFKNAANMLDCFIASGYPDNIEPQKWHNMGKKIGCYGNPQGGVEDPYIFRRNFGLLIWQYKYDIPMTYAYQGSTRFSTEGWGEFMRKKYKYRPHMMTYPSINGPIDTIQWEGYREGVDDVRYITTLIDTISRAKHSNSLTVRKTAEEANTYISALNLDENDRNLDTVRLEIIKYILKLQEGEK